MNEKQSIQALKSGSEQAFKTLMEVHQEKVLNTCLGFVPNRQDAEDLTQEVFVEVYRSIQNFREESKLSTWVYRIAVSKSLEFIRYRKRKKRVAFFQSLIGLDEKEERLQTKHFDHPGVQLEQKERTKLLYTYIDKLSDNQRAVFTLHKIEGLSYKEISEIMKVSLSSVESLMFRARKNLQKWLKEYYAKELI